MFDASILESDSRPYSVINGITRGSILGLLAPLVPMLLAFVAIVVGGDSQPEPEDFAPDRERIDANWLDGPMGPVYWVVSGILLFWRNSVWSPAIHGNPLGTSWDWVLSIGCLVVTARLLLLPMLVRQIKAQRQMSELQPRIHELQARCRGDRERLQKELMELYRSEKVNPLMGCLPVLIQAPAMFGVYHIVSRLNPTVTVAEATRFGWTAEEFNAASHARFLGVPILGTYGAGGSLRVLFTVGVLLLIWIGVSFVNSYRSLVSKGGWSPDRSQRASQRFIIYGMPAVQCVTVLMVPAGMVIYMLIQSCFTLAQQWWIERRFPQPRPPIAEVPPPSGAFGISSLLAFGTVAMVAYPTMAIALSGGAVGVGLLTLVAALIIVMAGLRENAAARRGCAGPIRARHFLVDACRRGILGRRRRTFQFTEQWILEQLAIEYGHLDTGQYVAGQGDATYTAAGLMEPDEWVMSGTEKLEEIFYRKD